MSQNAAADQIVTTVRGKRVTMPLFGTSFDVIDGPGKWDLMMYAFDRIGTIGDRRVIRFEAKGIGFFELHDATMRPIGTGESWEFEGLAAKLNAGGYGWFHRCKMSFRTDKRKGGVELYAD